MPYPYVSAGQNLGPPSATFHNALIDILNERELLGPRGGGHGSTVSKNTVERNGTTVLVYNDSGIAVDKFGILGIDSIVIAPADNLSEFQQSPIISCITPDVDAHRGRFVVTLEPLGVGDYGTAMVSGVVPVQVTMDANSYGWADVKDEDDASLQSAPTGSAQILLVESGTGVKWAFCLLGTGGLDYDRCTCLLKGAISGTGTKTVDNVAVIRGTSPLSDPTDTAEELSVENTLAWDGDDDGKAMIEYNATEDNWQFYQVECPA